MHERSGTNSEFGVKRSRTCTGADVFGLTNSEDYVLAEYNLAGFEKGTIDAWIAPRRLTISAKYFQKEAGLAGEHHNDEGPAFRCVQLPADIDPLQVTLLSACCFLLLFSGMHRGKL